MWYIKWKPMKNPIQNCQYNIHMTPYLTVSSWKWPKNGFYWQIPWWEGHVHTEWAVKLKIGMDNALCLYFQNQKYFLRWGTLPPHGGVNGGTRPKIFSIFCGQKSAWNILHERPGNFDCGIKLEIDDRQQRRSRRIRKFIFSFNYTTFNIRYLSLRLILRNPNWLKL